MTRADADRALVESSAAELRDLVARGDLTPRKLVDVSVDRAIAVDAWRHGLNILLHEDRSDAAVRTVSRRNKKQDVRVRLPAFRSL